MAGETSQTLDRGLRVLACLAAHGRAMSATELAAEMGLNRTVLHRLLATLEGHGLVRRGDDARFGLGTALLGLAAAVQPWLRSGATPVLRRLAQDVGATAHLTVADGSEALAVAVVEPSWTDYHVAYRVGARHRLDRGAAGRAMLLDADHDGRTYVRTAGELQAGAHGLAAPVRGVRGVVASVGVVTLGELDEGVVGARVLAAAVEVADALR